MAHAAPVPGPSRYVLAIDLGTSGPKVGLVDDAGRVVASAVRKNALILLPGGGAEQDAREWWQTVREAAREVVQRAAVPKEARSSGWGVPASGRRWSRWTPTLSR